MSTMFENSSEDKDRKDGLFLERLETFMDKCLADIKAFAERELRSYEETRRSVAEWHAKYLFQPSTITPPINVDRRTLVRSILCDASRILESLSETSGIQSFLLSVDPQDASDAGFLGGSLQGREFWRGMRGGGENGAKVFKLYCLNDQKESTCLKSGDTAISSSQPLVSYTSAKPARSLKTELYETVRKSLRSASGIRNAEMKWTNPERLDVYGVRLTGWPPGIPAQNPSSLKVNQNKQLLESFHNGNTKFERIWNCEQSNGTNTPVEAGSEDNDDFSWAYDADAPMPVVSMPASRNSLAIVPSHTLNSTQWNAAPSGVSDMQPLTHASPLLDEWTQFPLSPSTSDSVWDYHEGVLRYKKRPRSEEPAI